MTGIPPFARAQAYATPVLLGWRKALLGAKWLGSQGRAQRTKIDTELTRRQAQAIPKTK
jgi:hypothetical protein